MSTLPKLDQYQLFYEQITVPQGRKLSLQRRKASRKAQIRKSVLANVDSQPLLK